MGSSACVPWLLQELQTACNLSLLNYCLTQNWAFVHCLVIRGKMKMLDNRMTNLVILWLGACSVFAYLPRVKLLKLFLPRSQYGMAFVEYWHFRRSWTCNVNNTNALIVHQERCDLNKKEVTASHLLFKVLEGGWFKAIYHLLCTLFRNHWFPALQWRVSSESWHQWKHHLHISSSIYQTFVQKCFHNRLGVFQSCIYSFFSNFCLFPLIFLF